MSAQGMWPVRWRAACASWIAASSWNWPGCRSLDAACRCAWPTRSTTDPIELRLVHAVARAALGHRCAPLHAMHSARAVQAGPAPRARQAIAMPQGAPGAAPHRPGTLLALPTHLRSSAGCRRRRSRGSTAVDAVRSGPAPAGSSNRMPGGPDLRLRPHQALGHRLGRHQTNARAMRVASRPSTVCSISSAAHRCVDRRMRADEHQPQAGRPGRVAGGERGAGVVVAWMQNGDRRILGEVGGGVRPSAGVASRGPSSASLRANRGRRRAGHLGEGAGERLGQRVLCGRDVAPLPGQPRERAVRSEPRGGRDRGRPRAGVPGRGLTRAHRRHRPDLGAADGPCSGSCRPTPAPRRATATSMTT